MHPTQLFGSVVRTYKLWELKTWVTSENSMSRCRHVRASEKRSRSKCGRRIHVVCQFCQEVKEILCICSPAAILTKYPEIQRDSSESPTEWQVTFQMHPQANILSKNDESDWCSLYFILSFPMHRYALSYMLPREDEKMCLLIHRSLGYTGIRDWSCFDLVISRELATFWGPFLSPSLIPIGEILKYKSFDWRFTFDVFFTGSNLSLTRLLLSH